MTFASRKLPAGPRLLAIAGVVAVIAFLSLLTLLNATLKSNRPHNATSATPALTPAAATPLSPQSPRSPYSPETVLGDSLCKLPGVYKTGTITEAPEAVWQEGTTMRYPTSSVYGPVSLTETGIRNCFQRSPLGALFAAANAVEQSSGARQSQWAEYALTEGKMRDRWISQAESVKPEDLDIKNTRYTIKGFRLISYDGDSARIDLALEAEKSKNRDLISMIYHLVWLDGDWRVYLPADDIPYDVISISDITGYIPWG